MKRVAVIVGANDAPPGRQNLRFAHADANEMANVLEQVGGFAASDVTVLLDPHPTDLMAAFDSVAKTVASAQGNALFVFYYSGHSDGQSLFPHGETLALADVRQRVEGLGAHIRVGILDTCRGGSWTQSKGLTVGPPLSVADLLNVDTEGTALLSSSSGFENAHEADAVKGSFFTHYLAAGLRGAADRAADGNVTLQEAFDYAKERTVSESARLAKTPQHPSFDLTLRGRQDIVLSVLSASTSALQVTAARAAVEIIQLSSGTSIADVPVSSGSLRIALPPGHYLLRSIVGDRVYTKEVDIAPGQTTSVNDSQLDATGSGALAMKGADANELQLEEHSTPLKHWWLLQASAGVSDMPQTSTNTLGVTPNQQSSTTTTTINRQFVLDLGLQFAITDRLSWALPLPAFAYRFGTEGKTELVARAGLTSIGYDNGDGVLGSVDAGAGLRVWTAPRQSFIASAGVDYYDTQGSENNFRGNLRVFGSVGYAWTIKDVVTLHFAVGTDVRFYSPTPTPGAGSTFGNDGPTPIPTANKPQWGGIQLGSIQSLGYRQLPLIEIHLSKRVSLDGYASWGLGNGGLQDTYKAGFTVSF